MKWLIALLAIPVCAQPSITCTAPVAAVTWTANPAYPQVYLRIEPNPDGRTSPHPYPAPGFTSAMQVGPVNGGTFNLPATTGPWLAYAFQNSPYVEFPAVQFTCAAAPTPPPTPTPGPTPTAGITITLDGKTVGTFGTLKLVTGVNINIILTDNKDGSATIQVSAPATTTGAAQ